LVYRPFTAPAPTIELSMGCRAHDSSPVLPHFLAIARETARDHAR